MFAAMFKGAKVTEDLDEAYPLRKDVDISMHSKFRPRKKKRLSEEKWRASFDAEGRLVHMEEVIETIRKGGVDPKIRPEVWEFLLGVFDPKSTRAEREALRRARRELYSNLKLECNMVDPVVGVGVVVDFPRVREDGTDVPVPANCDNPMIAMLDMTKQDEEAGGSCLVQHSADLNPVSSFVRDNSVVKDHAASATIGRGRSQTRAEVFERVGPEKVRKWRLGLHQIGVDVNRADRTLQFYEEEGNRVRLMGVLALYSWFDSEVGYCQGMGDLMSPMVVLFDDNADAFWCFERLMRKVRQDFIGTASSLGVQSEINRLIEAMKIYLADVFVHLDEIGAGSLFFTVRAIMCMFRRELSFADALYLWEMQWAWEYDAEQVEKMAAEERKALRGVSRDPVKGSCRVTFLEDDDVYDLRNTIDSAQKSMREAPQASNGAATTNGGPEFPTSRSADNDSGPITFSGPLTATERDAVQRSRQKRASRFRGGKLMLGSVAEPEVRGGEGNEAAGGKNPRPPIRFASMPKASLTKDLIQRALGEGKRPTNQAPKLAEMKSGKGIRATLRRHLHSRTHIFHKDEAPAPATPDAGGAARSRFSGKASASVKAPAYPRQASKAKAGLPRDESMGWAQGLEALEEIEEGMTADKILNATGDVEVDEEESVSRLNTFCVLAVLAEAKDKLLECDGMDDVVDVFNEEASLWDVKDLCKSAKEIKNWYQHWIMGQ